MKSSIAALLLGTLVYSSAVSEAARCTVGNDRDGQIIVAESNQSCVIYQKECSWYNIIGCSESFDRSRGFKVVAAVLPDDKCQALKTADPASSEVANVNCCKDDLCNDPKNFSFVKDTAFPAAPSPTASATKPSATKTPQPAANAGMMNQAPVAGLAAVAGLLSLLL